MLTRSPPAEGDYSPETRTTLLLTKMTVNDQDRRSAAGKGAHRGRNNLEELSITTTSGSDWAAAAAIGGSQPVAASTMPTRLYAAVNQRFCLMVLKARRPIRIASGTTRQSSCIRATCAASIAASVPAAPIAIPTSAWASAGASLMPSPTIATTWPDRCSRSTRRIFS